IYDYLRLLWARVGRSRCPACGAAVETDSASTAAQRVVETRGGARALICFPLPRSAHTDHRLILENLRAMGFVRVMLDGQVHRLDALP
ncbi:MAG: hypothetical protein GWO39_11855, partial [Gammaproteobacteria bacterium]|nr:hypothetical protein [Gemmatimonadota bacterium]NIT64439.1 hypothetical protein [Gammaproteobacteria bacterium]NIV21468.1 hypothetical protein [Gammaproteobacteria bacterium]NIY33019.1 hypothetical protein [Gammaproteobacteria bacterium]